MGGDVRVKRSGGKTLTWFSGQSAKKKGKRTDGKKGDESRGCRNDGQGGSWTISRGDRTRA